MSLYLYSILIISFLCWLWFVRYCRQRPCLLWTSVLRPYSGPVHLPREKKGICSCVRCVLMTCGEGRLSRSEQFVEYFYSAPLLDVATVCLSPDWHCVLRQLAASQVCLLWLMPAWQADFMLLDQRCLQRLTVYRGHRRTLFFLPGIIALFIVCVGIIWNNSLVGGCAQAEVWTPATLYCTWRPSA